MSTFAEDDRSRTAAETGRVGPRTGGGDPLARLLEHIEGRTIRGHQLALQVIADGHGGTRAAGTPGYDASVAYVSERLTRAGYAVTLQPFEVTAWFPQAPAVLEQVVPAPLEYVEGVDFLLMRNSDGGDVDANVHAVDLRLGAPETSTSGCEAGDFVNFPAGAIALIQRGACSFRLKAELAAAAGARAAIVFNQGSADREPLFDGSVTTHYGGGIPVFTTSYAQGRTWALMPVLRLHVVADVFRGPRETVNVIAETSGGRADRIVMVGAHLDSVLGGPGLQDNGSGSAALLAVAEAVAALPLENTVRFAWWGAEELGLVGSYRYVNSLSQAELDALMLYVNLDMIGSPNFVRFVLDSDGSSFGTTGPAGSAAVEAAMIDYFVSRGIPVEPSKPSFRSDYAAFHHAGVPFGGLFTGAEGVKTTAQAIVHGGTSGIAYDPCYHDACDTWDNVATAVLTTNAEAAAQTLYLFATGRATLPALAKARRSPGKPTANAGCHTHAAPAVD